MTLLAILIYLALGILTMSWLIHRTGWPDAVSPTSDACLGVLVWPLIMCAIVMRMLYLGMIRALEWLSGVRRP